MPKTTHYEILKVGVEPSHRFLTAPHYRGKYTSYDGDTGFMTGSSWGTSGEAHKFMKLEDAVKDHREIQNSYIIWVGEHDDGSEGWGIPHYRSEGWGEVNRDYIARTF